MSNRLTIRLQRSGKQIEQNDVLTFDVVSSYEVARCVRGRVDSTTGQNDWDEANCYRASDTGPGRMRVQFDSPVRRRSHTRATCTANLVASAITAPVPLSYTATSEPGGNGRQLGIVGGIPGIRLSFSGGQGTARSQGHRREFRVQLGDRIYATSFGLTARG